jgi:glyoxylase-like metal-dependent hydrolase (beta-lactamase superfamily II)
MTTLQFLGATRTVTGSKYLLEADGGRVLVDCGLFQGLKELRLRNWQPLPVNPSSINWVILTHAHIDHTGYLPRLVRDGFDGPIYATKATADLLGILLPDSARLQEEDADYANRKGFSKHHPALPLYTEDDARAALKLIHPIDFGQNVQISKAIQARFIPAGHILGSSFVKAEIARGGGGGGPRAPPPTEGAQSQDASLRDRRKRSGRSSGAGAFGSAPPPARRLAPVHLPRRSSGGGVSRRYCWDSTATMSTGLGGDESTWLA